MIRRFVNWLLYNYDCCRECDELTATPHHSQEWVVLREEGEGRAKLYLPAAVKGQRPRYDGDGAQV